MAEYLAQDSCALPINYSRLISLFRNTNQAFPFDGNRVEAYTLGLSMLQSLLRELGKATKRIHMEFYAAHADAFAFDPAGAVAGMFPTVFLKRCARPVSRYAAF